MESPHTTIHWCMAFRVNVNAPDTADDSSGSKQSWVFTSKERDVCGTKTKSQKADSLLVSLKCAKSQTTKRPPNLAAFVFTPT